ncbi:HD domain-containing phosphohydrolase [Spirochaetota bacterium]
MKKLIYFAEKFDINNFDMQPIPVDIYNSKGAILAPSGQKLPKKRLQNVYIFEEDLSKFKISDIDIPENSAEEISEPNNVLIGIKNEEPREEIAPNPEKLEYILSDEYEEERAHQIEEKIDKIGFEAIPEVKDNLKKNVHQIKEIFKKNLIGNEIKLDCKENAKISHSIASYLDEILNSNLYAADYIDMINEVRSKENYLFAHSCSVAFYALAIVKKLKFLKEDSENKNFGRWVPKKTKKNPHIGEPLPMSNQLLRYIDHQKNIVIVKFNDEIREILFDDIHNLIYNYTKIDYTKKYPSLRCNFDDESRRTIAMAGLNSDIGKVCIPNSILNKPEKLSLYETNLIQKHPAYSVAKLKEVGIDNPNMFAYILGHHRIDFEMGYPPIKKMPPYESRIIAIADIYDAMVSPKYYGRKSSHDSALEYITELFEQGCFDLPLYTCAMHTFSEYNHGYTKKRKRKIIDMDF